MVSSATSQLCSMEQNTSRNLLKDHQLLQNGSPNRVVLTSWCSPYFRIIFRSQHLISEPAFPGSLGFPPSWPTATHLRRGLGLRVHQKCPAVAEKHPWLNELERWVWRVGHGFAMAMGSGFTASRWVRCCSVLVPEFGFGQSLYKRNACYCNPEIHGQWRYSSAFHSEHYDHYEDETILNSEQMNCRAKHPKCCHQNGDVLSFFS